MKRLALAAAACAFAFAAPAGAHPTFRRCGPHRCSREHRAYRVRCGGQEWLTPQRARVPDGTPSWACPSIIPAFTARQLEEAA